MRRGFLALPILPLLALTPACDAEETTSEEFRGLSALAGLTEDLEVDLSLEMAGGEDGDGPIWEILKVAGTEEPVAVSDGPAIDGNFLLELDGNDIYDAEGNLTCTIHSPYLGSKVRQVVGTDGDEVLLTIYQNYILEGHIALKDTSSVAFQRTLMERLLFTLQGNEIHDGKVSSDSLLMIANKDLETISEDRKLLIGALIEGYCGSPGLGN